MNLGLMHSTATSPVPDFASIDSLLTEPNPKFPSFSSFPPFDPEQTITYPAAVKSRCPFRLTSCDPMISQPVSSQVFSITLAWPVPFVLSHSCVFSEQPSRTSYVFSSNFERTISSLTSSVCLTYSIYLLPSPFAQTGSCLSASVKGGNSPDTPRPSPCRIWCLLTLI